MAAQQCVHNYETESAKWNSAIINLIVYTCALHTPGQTVKTAYEDRTFANLNG